MVMNTGFTFIALLAAAFGSVFTQTSTAQVLHSVYFESGSSHVNSTQEQDLAQWLKSYLPLRETKLILKAYCDERSTDDHNKTLSNARGKEIASILNKKGYAHIAVAPMGELQCPDKNESCMKLQRRVDIVQESTSGDLDFSQLFNQKPFQRFVMKPNENNIIIGAEGTQIHFQKNCFGDDFTQNTDTVEIYLREYTNTAEMVLAGITTSVGEQMIETGGTIEVYAVLKNTGDSLSLTKPMGIIYSGRQYNDRMQAFFLNKTFEQDSSQKFSCVSWANPDESFDYMFRETSFYENIDARNKAKEIARDAIEADPKIIQVEGPAMFNDQDKLNARKVLMSAKHGDDAYQMIALQQIVYEYMQPVKGSANDATVLTSNNNDSYDRDKKQVKASDLSSKQTSYYVPSKQLGFINCDRWLNSGLKLANVDMKESDNSAYYVLMFKDISSVMPVYAQLNSLFFPNIPIGKEAMLIGLNHKNDTYYFGYKNVICDGTPLDIELKPSSQEEIESVIAGM
jgi:hypothetical protein